MSEHIESIQSILPEKPRVNIYLQRFKTIEQRFLEKVDKASSPFECWLWKGSKHERGYGHFKMGKGFRDGRAHRASWVIYRGKIPDGFEVAHDCPGGDNTSCVNPDHLFLATHARNMRDMVEKGRSAKGEKSSAALYAERKPRGEAHFLAKLTEAKVREIRLRVQNGEGIRAVGRAYNMGKSTISQIVHRKTWRHVI